MATRNFVPRKDGEGSVGKSRKRWGAAYIETLFVKAVEVLGGETENDTQPATVGWVKNKFYGLVQKALEASGVVFYNSSNSLHGVFGYVVFGDFFGGLTIQWVENILVEQGGTDYVYPISFKEYGYAFCSGTVSNLKNVMFVAASKKNKVTIRHSESSGHYTTCLFAIGR